MVTVHVRGDNEDKILNKIFDVQCTLKYHLFCRYLRAYYKEMISLYIHRNIKCEHLIDF